MLAYPLLKGKSQSSSHVSSFILGSLALYFKCFKIVGKHLKYFFLVTSKFDSLVTIKQIKSNKLEASSVSDFSLREIAKPSCGEQMYLTWLSTE